MSRSQRKSLVKAARDPLAQSVARATNPVKQAQLRSSTARSFSQVGARIGSTVRPKAKGVDLGEIEPSASIATPDSKSATLPVNVDVRSDVLEPVRTDVDGITTFTTSYTFEPLPGVVVSGFTSLCLDLGTLAASNIANPFPYPTYSTEE